MGAIIVTQQIALLCPETISALYLRHCGLTEHIDRQFVQALKEVRPTCPSPTLRRILCIISLLRLALWSLPLPVAHPLPLFLA